MFNFNGKNYYVPQAYGAVEIIQLGGGSLPDFSIGVIIAPSPLGCPYSGTFNGKAFDAEDVFSAYDDIQALKKDYGDGDLLTKFIFAKKTAGGNSIFVLNSRKNTPYSHTDSGGGIKFEPTKHFYGAPGMRTYYSCAESASTTVLTSGTATAGANTSLTDSGASWGTTQYVDKWVEITGGTGIGQTRKIVSHTGTVLTVATWTTNPDTTSTYRIIQAKFTMSFTPPKYVKMLRSDVSVNDTYFYVDGKEDLYEGQKIYIGRGTASIANSTVDLLTIKNIDRTWTSSGYKVYLDPTGTLPTIAYTQAQYSFLFDQDISRKETYTFVGSDWNVQNIVKTINASSSIVFLTALTSTVPAVATAGYIAYLVVGDASTQATSPTVSTTDYANIAAAFPTWAKEFEIAFKTKIRLIDLGSYSSTDHGVFRDLAATLRSNPILAPICTIGGTNLGDTALTGNADTNPKYRALNLNDADFQLVAGGIDDYPAYLSLSSEIFGMRLSNPVLHNVTRDKIVASKVEKKWTYDQLTELIKAGVTTYGQNKTGRYIAFSINTYQDQSQQWNKEDKKSYLTAQMDKADYVYRGVLEYLDLNGIGTDSKREDITRSLDTHLTKYLENGNVTGYSLSAKAVEGGVIERVEIELPDQIDYVGLVLGIKTGRV